ncbi:MAG: hypothetical protein JO307_01785 [Bryobacterales bacterium]|nr:hypothetical protein [Bryobacterales bacterium]MBV9401719.1 hypothetical protein [Bryobacterales bacterium]
MRGRRCFAALACAAAIFSCGTLSRGQGLPLEPPHSSGAGVTGAFEGWFKNPDGTFSVLLGYFNRNQAQELDIPIGPNNRIEPEGPDRGQPTHFLPGRHWGLFAVKLPADFGKNKITWTLTVNGKTAVIPASLLPDYEISPFTEAAVGNTPPVVRFEQNGPSVQGPQGMTVQRSASPGKPLALTVWVSDDAKFTSSSSARPKNLGAPVVVRWSKYRGPGTVTFSQEKPAVEKIEDKTAAFSGKATAEATFSEAGEYVLHLLTTDYSGEGGGGFQCCWTNAEVKVSVKP